MACETYPHGVPPSLRENQLIDIKTLGFHDMLQDNRWRTKFISTSEKPPETFLGWAWGAITAGIRPITIHETTFNPATNPAAIYRDWDAVVELYSLTELTISTDKLIALGGLASVVSVGKPNSTRDGYLAGLWQPSLPSHLLWKTETYERIWNGSRETVIPTKYVKYTAPSWSWASIGGRISLTWCRNNYNPNDFLVILEDAKIESYSPSIFGPVHSGYLQVKGSLASILWEKGDISPSTNSLTARITEAFPMGHDRRKSVVIPSDSLT